MVVYQWAADLRSVQFQYGFGQRPHLKTPFRATRASRLFRPTRLDQTLGILKQVPARPEPVHGAHYRHRRTCPLEAGGAAVATPSATLTREPAERGDEQVILPGGLPVTCRRWPARSSRTFRSPIRLMAAG